MGTMNGKFFDQPQVPLSYALDLERCEDPRASIFEPHLEPPLPIYNPRARDYFSITYAPLSDTYQNFKSGMEEYIELSTSQSARIYRWLRWKFFSAYRRLFTIVFIANLASLLVLVVRDNGGLPGSEYESIHTAVSVNFAVAIALRNEHVVNFLFLASSSVRPSLPLCIRHWLAKVYGYGGIHSGCAIAAFVWYLAYAALVTHHYVWPPYVDMPTMVMTSATTLTLFAIVAFAHPAVRFRYHDWFEWTHRFAGWICIALLWAQTFDMACKSDNRDFASVMAAAVKLPSFWCLVIITICIAYPWSRLRRRCCTAEPLSEHAIRLHFSHDTAPHCSAVRLATNPLKATHAFAAIPEIGFQERGYSVVVSNAGDWTSQLIKKPPAKLWVKGAPLYGVLRVAVMFKPVLVVATGSGIGPCLSLFRGASGIDCRVLWCTPNPLRTYGQKILENVLEADPQAIIVDTKKSGRPDLVRLTWETFKSARCEAAVIISNPRTTEKVVHGLEVRGVPAYGPIFDS